MALAGNELWQNGFVITTLGELSLTTSLVGATFWSGFLRDPDGRLVVIVV